LSDEKVEFALNFIEEQIDNYDKIALVSSFGKDSMVITHLVIQVVPDIPVLWIRTPFLPPITYRFAVEVSDLWNLNLVSLISPFEDDETYMADLVYKPKLWQTNPELCCQIFKVHPVMTWIQENQYDAWFSGMRKTESEKRGMYTYVWRQGPFTKLHPILDFTEADIWRYIAVHKLPVHPYYAQGYRSIGCDLCSNPNVWDSERGGRWMDTMMEGGDCGIHCTPMYDKDVIKEHDKRISDD